MPSDICCLGARAGCDRLFLPIHMIVLHSMHYGKRTDHVIEKVPSKFDETGKESNYQSIMMMNTNAKLIHPISIEPFNIYGWSPVQTDHLNFSVSESCRGTLI